MEEIFATKIKIDYSRNISNFEMPLSENGRRHLIITGKNGSGKTTVLNGLKSYLIAFINSSQAGFENFLETHDIELNHLKSLIDSKKYIADNGKESENEIKKIDNRIRNVKARFINSLGGTQINFNLPKEIHSKYADGNFIISFFEAKRSKFLNEPIGPAKLDRKQHYQIDDNAGKDFIQYMVNQKVDQSFAKNNSDIEKVNQIEKWFNDFEEKLLDILDNKSAELYFDQKNYNFYINEPSKEPYTLNQLSDGYSAILDIVTELIMRMEEHKTKSYDVQGVVLIDEIETHLHVDLQKKVLPFLTSFFPKIQFIVTTHSPFVITSIENAVVCDLEKKIVLDNLSGYSYDAIVEGYFDADKYSTVLKQQVEEYETLMSKDELSEKEESRLQELKKHLEDIPKFLSDELTVKLQQIRLKNLNKKVKK